MAKKSKPGTFDPITHMLIARNADGENVYSGSCRGDLAYARRQACSMLRIDRSGTRARVDVYRYDRAVHWSQLQPLATVTQDGEKGVHA